MAPISNLLIAYNDAGAGTAAAHLDFSVTNPTFTAFIASDLSIGRETGAAFGAATRIANGSLTLDSDSTLTLGTGTAPATLNIGWSQSTANGTGNATGVFDALAKAANVDLHLSELNVGRGSVAGVGTGTLKVGSDGDDHRRERLLRPRQRHRHPRRTDRRRVASRLRHGADQQSAHRLQRRRQPAPPRPISTSRSTNPTFTAFIASDLSIGRETGAAFGAATGANGSLTLASNSTLTLGTRTAPATLNIGWSQSTANGTRQRHRRVRCARQGRRCRSPLERAERRSRCVAGVGTGTLKVGSDGDHHRRERLLRPRQRHRHPRRADRRRVASRHRRAPIGNLLIAYNDAGRGTAAAHLDFSADQSDLHRLHRQRSVDRPGDGRGLRRGHQVANGSLTLDSNSTLTLGTAAAPATLNIGWSQSTANGGTGNATGVFDATEGTLTAAPQHPHRRPNRQRRHCQRHLPDR